MFRGNAIQLFEHVDMTVIHEAHEFLAHLTRECLSSRLSDPSGTAVCLVLARCLVDPFPISLDNMFVGEIRAFILLFLFLLVLSLFIMLALLLGSWIIGGCRRLRGLRSFL